MKVGIVGQKGNSRAASLAATLCESLREEGVDIAVDETTAGALQAAAHWDEPETRASYASVDIEEMDDRDLVVSIGGDGTFLFAVRGAGEAPLMGINLGEVGFLNAVAPGDAVEAVGDVVEEYFQNGEIPTREVPRLQARGDDWSLTPALNEVVVQGAQRGHGQGLDLEVRVNGSLYESGHADGVLVSTPTGSTAYNLSEGGPLVHPVVEGFVVTEMCGDDTMPPLVVGYDSTVTVRIDDAESGVVVSDGRVVEEVAPPTQITIERAADPVRIAGPPLDFFTALGKLE
ncbi:NAD(+)/NADH kinase [Haloarculaceae archaeon H-GB2-1]|nr:NAD(+)/NADH kinase [Haloarculaceae archaeon H-GB1-1]MEA5389106.1 NAD(+)/NADH kinase [Haloarculaceae archaeon H-GB11]MEA5407167.1 NAD(+)/NADH kinase [Haloarculaceae archaeon H-GB2-1]